MNHGVNLAFLSCFPEEEERLYPPLTYIKPINEPGRKAVQRIPVNIGRPGANFKREGLPGIIQQEISKKFALFSGFLTEVCPRYTVKVIQA